MSLTNLNIGDVIPVKSLREVLPMGWQEWKTNKRGDCFQVMVLGVSNPEDGPFDVIKALKEQGFVATAELQQEMRERGYTGEF